MSRAHCLQNTLALILICSVAFAQDQVDTNIWHNVDCESIASFDELRELFVKNKVTFHDLEGVDSRRKRNGAGMHVGQSKLNRHGRMYAATFPGFPEFVLKIFRGHDVELSNFLEKPRPWCSLCREVRAMSVDAGKSTASLLAVSGGGGTSDTTDWVLWTKKLDIDLFSLTTYFLEKFDAGRLSNGKMVKVLVRVFLSAAKTLDAFHTSTGLVYIDVELRNFVVSDGIKDYEFESRIVDLEESRTSNELKSRLSTSERYVYHTILPGSEWCIPVNSDFASPEVKPYCCYRTFSIVDVPGRRAERRTGEVGTIEWEDEYDESMPLITRSSDIYFLGKQIYFVCELEKLHCPKTLMSIIQKCIAENPEERYQSAGELVNDLREHFPPSNSIWSSYLQSFFHSMAK